MTVPCTIERGIKISKEWSVSRDEKIVGSFMSNPEMWAMILAATLNEVYAKANDAVTSIDIR